MKSVGFEDFVSFSAEIGRDPRLVQGAGGNTSLKRDGMLWIKASGTWLRSAEEDRIFIPVDLAKLRANTSRKSEDPVAGCFYDHGTLRPSVETTLHSLMSHTVVAHVHSVNTIAHAMRTNGRADLQKRLQGIRWHWIPYLRPGLPLTQALQQALLLGPADVLVLASHGLVVAADTVEDTRALLSEVEERLHIEHRTSPPASVDTLQSLIGKGSFVLPEFEQAHAIATDPVSYQLATGGTLYPDHVVFLGSGVFGADSAETARNYFRSFTPDDPQAPRAIAVKGVGVLVHESVPPAGHALLEGLALVGARAEKNSPARYLSREDEWELVNWEAEKFRTAMQQDGTYD